MLTYPDRQKFNRIRAQWETGEPDCPRSPDMLGRREKQARLHGVGDDTCNSGGNRFKRRLSHGLSFISNPLSQRKITPGRQLPGTILPNATMKNESRPSDQHKPSKTIRDFTVINQPSSSADQCTPPKSISSVQPFIDSHTTPKPLPRSQTMSFIPRPSIGTLDPPSENMVSSSSSKTRVSSIHTNPIIRVASSKIPSPSPSQDGPGRGSPRQHISLHTTQQFKQIGAGVAFAGGLNQNPSRASMRSYTTPNLVKGFESPQQPFMMARKPKTRQKSTGPPVILTPLKENTPTSGYGNRRMSQLQAMNPRHETLVKPPTMTNKHPPDSVNTPRHGKQAIRTTPSASEKRSSTYSRAPTPATAQKISKSQHGHQMSGVSIDQPRLMGPMNAPTPIPAQASGRKSGLLRASTEADLRVNALGAASVFSTQDFHRRSLEVKSKEVRLPRSSTFHYIPRAYLGTPPPMPAIPEQYKSPVYIRGKCEPSSTASEEILPQSQPSVPEPGPLLFAQMNRQSEVERMSQKSSDFEIDVEGMDFAKSEVPETSDEGELIPILKTVPRVTREQRPFSVNEGVSNANSTALQVKDYMPPIWWAGRFQARYDQWRTEALRAEADPTYQLDGPLGECKLSEEKLAACYILLQLRDLCGSNKAADSLWAFEYKYRQDHKLLGTMLNVSPMSSRKQDERTRVGRAFRKLTPRKSSLVSLIKGKGWTRLEDSRSTHGSSETELLFGADRGPPAGTS